MRLARSIAGVLICTIAVSACTFVGDVRKDVGLGPELDRAAISRLQNEALVACRCVQRQPTKAVSECAAVYERDAGQFSRTTWASACMPISTRVDEIKDGQGHRTLIFQYYGPGGPLCSEAEARTVNDAWRTNFTRSDNGAAAGRAAERVYKAIVAGQTVSVGRGAKVCS